MHQCINAKTYPCLRVKLVDSVFCLASEHVTMTHKHLSIPPSHHHFIYTPPSLPLSFWISTVWWLSCFGLGLRHTFSLTHTHTHTLCPFALWVESDPNANLGAWMASSVQQMLWSTHTPTLRKEREMFVLAFEWKVLFLFLAPLSVFHSAHCAA